jgi:hypothetical protein
MKSMEEEEGGGGGRGGDRVRERAETGQGMKKGQQQ